VRACCVGVSVVMCAFRVRNCAVCSGSGDRYVVVGRGESVSDCSRTMDQPETRYVAVGDADVAYRVVGEGPPDLLFVFGLGSHVEFFWANPVTAEFLTRLAAFSRLIFFDRRGTGASDGVFRNALPTWEEWTEDIDAVLGAVGSRRTAILASLDVGP
jgi:hypothetical protein